MVDECSSDEVEVESEEKLCNAKTFYCELKSLLMRKSIIVEDLVSLSIANFHELS